MPRRGRRSVYRADHLRYPELQCIAIQPTLRSSHAHRAASVPQFVLAFRTLALHVLERIGASSHSVGQSRSMKLSGTFPMTFSVARTVGQRKAWRERKCVWTQ